MIHYGYDSPKNAITPKKLFADIKAAGYIPSQKFSVLKKYPQFFMCRSSGNNNQSATYYAKGI